MATLAAAMVSLAACGDPDATRATPEFEERRAPPAAGDAPGTLSGPGEAAPLSAAGNPDLTAELTTDSPGGGVIGVWAKDPGTCGVTEGRDIPIRITPRTFTGPYGRCDLREARESGRGTWETRLQCPEAPEWQRVTLQVEENVLYVIYHELDDQGVSYIRCTPE